MSTLSTKDQSLSEKVINGFTKLGTSLIWPSKVSNYFQFGFLGISNLQYIVIILWTQLGLIHFGDEAVPRTIFKTCKVLLMKDLIDVGDNPLLIIVYLYFAFILIVIGFISYKAAYKSLSETVKATIFIVGQFHLSFAFWTANSLLFETLTMDQRGTASIYNQTFNSSGIQAVHILLLIINYTITVILAFFSYDPFQGSNALSMHTPRFQVLTFLFKGVIIGFSPSQNSYDKSDVWIWTFLGFIISLIRHYNAINTFPYYEYRALNVSLAFSSVSLLLSGLSYTFLVIRSFTPFSGIAMISIQVFLIILIVICQKNYLLRSIKKLLSLQDKDLKSENDILKKIFALNYVLSNTKVTVSNDEDYKTQDLFFWSLWSRSEDEFSGVQDVNGMNAFQLKYSSVINMMIYELLSNSFQRFKFNTKLKIFLANYILSKNINIIIGYSYLRQAMSHKLSNQIIGTALLELYQQKVHRSFKDHLDVKTLLDSENMSNTLIQMLYSNTAKYMEFWKSYCKPRLEIKDLLEKARSIEIQDMSIKNYWATFTYKDKFFPYSQRIIYSIYLSLMRDASFSSVLLQESTRFAEYENKQTSQPDRDITKETLASGDNIIVQISTGKDKLGTVQYISSNLAEELSWEKNEITGKNINIMFPHFVGGTRITRLSEYHQANANNNRTRFHKSVDSYVRHKLGYFIPCRTYMSFHPDLKEELRYLLVIRLKTAYEDQIMLNQEGAVLGYTKNIGRTLGLVKDEKINIRDFCLNTESLNFLNNIKIPERSQLALKFAKISLNERDRAIIDFLVVLTPFHYYALEFYLLTFSSDSIVDNFLKEYPESSKKRDFTDNIKVNGDEDEEFSIPSEKDLKEAEAVVLSPTYLTSKPDRINTMLVSTERLLSSPRQTPNGIQNEIHSFRFTSESSPRRLANRLPENVFQSIKANKVESEDNLTPSLHKSNSKNRFNRALHSIREDNLMRIFSVLLILLVAFAGIMLFILQRENTNAMDLVTGNVEMVGTSVTRLQRIINLYGLCMYFVLLDLNKIFDNRFAFLGIPSLRALNYPRFKAIGQDLLNTNTKIRNMMYKLDSSLTEGLNEEFPILDFSPQTGTFTSTRSMNSFDLITELGARILKLGQTNPITSLNNTDIQFVVKNAINELLVHCEGGINVVVADTKVKLKNLNSNFIIVTCALACFELSLLALLIYRIRLFFQNREKALDIFKRLEEKEITEHLNTVERFYLLLMKYDMDIKRISLQIRKEDLSVKPSTTKDLQILRAKNANMKGTNIQIIKILFTLILFFILIFSGYIITMVVINQQNVTVQRKIDLMVISNFHFYELYMLWATTSQYIGQSRSITIRGNPANEEYNRVFADLANMNADFLNVIDRDKGLGEDSLLVELFTGNLCQIAASPWAISVGNPCYVVDGISAKGIISIESYFEFKMQQMKATYDDSAQTYDDAVSLLNDEGFIQAQAIVPGYLFPACDKANTRMQVQLSKDATKFTNSIQGLVIGYIAVYVVILMFVWYGIRKPFLHERGKWKNLLRLIPPSILGSHKLLRRFVVYNYDFN